MTYEIIKTNDGYMILTRPATDYLHDSNGDNLWDTHAEAQAVIDKMPKLKTYRITASITTYCYANVEAASEEEAYEIAQGMDGGEFTTDPMRGDWSINSVHEAEE